MKNNEKENHMKKIKVGIVGYGNIGRGVELAVNASEDMELAAVFTRRDPAGIEVKTKTARALHVDEALSLKGEIDVMALCGGSATDLPEQGPMFAAHFNTVDSFDTHANIPEYFEKVDAAARDTVSIISVGWDPGLFSMQRLLAQAVLPNGSTQTFWGRGVSQGHSDAIRRVDGVVNAIQYTVPIEKAVAAVRGGDVSAMSAREKHLRECFVVAAEGADKAVIEREIKTMPNYFDEYDTVVHFVSEEELAKDHAKMPHGGFVIRSGKTGENTQIVEYSLKLESNPQFTGAILAVYARAAARMAKDGMTGAKTVFDVPLACLWSQSRSDMLKLL
jgi:diaminopimelate dehydrogenase